MTYNVLAFASVMLTAVAMGAGLAHLLELSSRLPLSAAEYLTSDRDQVTENWQRLPDDWQALRRTWEYPHAFGCGLNFTARAALVIGLLPGRG
jgi:hypothetical protein